MCLQVMVKMQSVQNEEKRRNYFETLLARISGWLARFASNLVCRLA